MQIVIGLLIGGVLAGFGGFSIYRSLIEGQYRDKPYWFAPAGALLGLGVLIILVPIVFTIARTPGQGVAILFAFFGIAAIGVGLYLLVNQYDLLKNQTSVTGQVVGNTTRRDDDKLLYFPVVRYTAEDGSLYQLDSTVGTGRPTVGEGDRVKVLYNPIRPNEGQIVTFQTFWMLPVLVLATGAAFFLLSALLLAR